MFVIAVHVLSLGLKFYDQPVLFLCFVVAFAPFAPAATKVMFSWSQLFGCTYMFYGCIRKLFWQKSGLVKDIYAND